MLGAPNSVSSTYGYTDSYNNVNFTLARTGRIDKLSGGRCQWEDFAAVKKRMAKFMAGGFLAVCGK